MTAGLRRAFVRGTAWNLVSQVVDPRCDGHPLQAAGKDMWVVPQQCRDVDWTIAAQSVQDGETDASAQATIAFTGKRMWLISEPTSLLRGWGFEHVSAVLLARATFWYEIDVALQKERGRGLDELVPDLVGWAALRPTFWIATTDVSSRRGAQIPAYH